MTEIVDRPVRTGGYRAPRRHSVTFAGGITGVCRVTAALSDSGCRICDFATDMHEGVGISGVTFTVAATPVEAETLAEQLRVLPEVVAVDPC